MARLTRTKTGLWTTRKVIPTDVRAAYGKREEKPTWPASLSPGQARAEFGVWLAGVEERIAALRSSGAGPAVELTQRQSRALAGKWYRTMEQRFGDNPGDELGWEIGLEDLYPQETEESYRATQRGNSEPYEGPWRITPMLAREMQWLLDMEDMRITPSASDRLLQDMADLYIASHLMIRRCRGDYGADSLVDTLPEWEAATPARGVSVTSGPKIMSLFDGYVAERGPAEATVKAWKRMIQHLVAFLGHDDAVLSRRMTSFAGRIGC